MDKHQLLNRYQGGVGKEYERMPFVKAITGKALALRRSEGFARCRTQKVSKTRQNDRN